MLLKELHPADIAEILEDTPINFGLKVLESLDNESSAAVLLELDEDLRAGFLTTFSSEKIAKEVLDEIDSDDAADILNELSEQRKNEVITNIEDQEFAKDVVELTSYDEDTAGALMDKEFLAVNKDWNVITTIKELRKQAEEISHIYTIYVVDNDNLLEGTLSLKKLLTTSTKTKVKDLFNKKVRSVNVLDSLDDVEQVMSKYDLFVIPVVDQQNALVGRITLDDVVDRIKEEAERDYQIASGLYTEVENDDSIAEHTKSRLPWLILGLFGGFFSAKIIGLFDSAIGDFPELFFFTPLVAAMGGNVGVQSSAIIVQGIAANNLKGTLWQRFIKELTLALFQGVILGLLVYGLCILGNYDTRIAITLGVSLLAVIIFAALIGTFVPIVLDKKNIDPALATGPFITTSNDIIGLLIYFKIAAWMLQF